MQFLLFVLQAYEFIENDQSLSALQYFGGGAFGLNKNIIWIKRNADEKMKFILAAASTAILQIKANSRQGATLNAMFFQRTKAGRGLGKKSPNSCLAFIFYRALQVS